MEQQSTVAESVSGGGRRSVETSRRKVNNTEAMDQQFEQSTFAESAASNPATQAAAAEEEEPKENVLLVPDEITDVILEVEGKELHTNRAVLAHYSPVFRAMFYSTFREKACNKVPLPGKRYDSMVTFCNVLYPRSASAKYLIDDSNLMELLTLADEYQTNKVTVACQNYIGDELCAILLSFCRYSANRFQSKQRNAQPVKARFSSCASTSIPRANAQPARGGSLFGACTSIPRANAQPAFGGSVFGASTSVPIANQVQLMTQTPKCGQKVTKRIMIDKLLLYLWACDAYRMPVYRDSIKSLLVDMAVVLKDLSQSRHYSSLPHVTRADLTEELCTKLDGSRQFVETDVMGVASVSLF